MTNAPLIDDPGLAFAKPEERLATEGEAGIAARAALVRDAVAAASLPDVAKESLDETILRLSALRPLAYDQVREREAARLGVRVGTLDAAVSKERDDDCDGDDNLAAPVPWHEPVSARELVGDLAAIILRYMVLPRGGAETVVLWILHCYFHDAALISPILAVTSPSPECGKTTLLDLLDALVPRPLSSSNITTAALFRSVEKWSPTLLVDEADTFLKSSDELRGVINSGHRRSAAFVLRTVGDAHEPKRFRTWCPKAIALIGKLPATLASRSIHIELRRKTAAESVEPLRIDRPAEFEQLRRRCARLALDHLEGIRSTDPDLPRALHGRRADNWRQLIAIADLAGPDFGERIRQVASEAAATESEDTIGIMLLEDLRKLFGERGTNRLTSSEIVEALTVMEERPWSELREGRPITARQLAKLLEPFKVTPTKFRAKGVTPGTRGYDLEAFSDVFKRYLPEVESRRATAPQGPVSVPVSAAVTPRAGTIVADRNETKGSLEGRCGAVASNDGSDERTATFEERAAIIEFDGGYSRVFAERTAMAQHSSRPGDTGGFASHGDLGE